MNYDEEGVGEEKGFSVDMDNDDELLEPLDEINDFGLDEEDPDKDR